MKRKVVAALEAPGESCAGTIRASKKQTCTGPFFPLMPWSWVLGLAPFGEAMKGKTRRRGWESAAAVAARWGGVLVQEEEAAAAAHFTEWA